MKLVRLIYASTFGSRINLKEFENILDQSRENNRKLHITGALCYAPGNFLQCLEGPRDAVNLLYNRIVGDTRHTDVTLLSYEDIEERLFKDWTMAYIRADRITRNILQTFGITGNFDPYTMTARQSLGLIKSLADKKQRTLALADTHDE